MSHNYASHVLRTLLNILSGASLEKQESANRSKRSKKYTSNHQMRGAASVSIVDKTNKDRLPRETAKYLKVSQNPLKTLPIL